MAENALNVTELKERFVDVSEVMQADIKKLVQFQITNKCQSILKKIYAKNPQICCKFSSMIQSCDRFDFSRIW